MRFLRILCIASAVALPSLICPSPALALFDDSVERGKALRNLLLEALDHATSVEVIEHTSQYDRPSEKGDKEQPLGTITLNKEQIERLRNALPLAKDYSGVMALDWIFNEHHAIVIKSANGDVLTLHLCFLCGELAINKNDARIMPDGWTESLGAFVQSFGMHPSGPWPMPKK